MRHWRVNPPIHKLAAWHWQFKAPDVQAKPAEQDLQSIAQYGMPAQILPAAEYDRHLKELGIL